MCVLAAIAVLSARTSGADLPLSIDPLGGVSDMRCLFAAIVAGAVAFAVPAKPLRANDDSAVAELRSFISVPVDARLDAALAARDHRFLGVYGYALEVPGVPQSESARISSNGVLAIPGTSDALVSEEHGGLNERARAYAAEYNTLLLGRLKRMP